jgi:serine/threonine protein kinase
MQMQLSVGQRLGPYELLQPIGAGGMGEVYKARDTRLDRVVAIKISNERFSERFELEARAVAALNHPNICTLYDVGPNYLVMEYIEGESPKGPMPLEEALRIGRQIAEALEAAHEKGITHRDLKPANIKIKPDGTVKVLDFGLAKVAPTTGSSDERSPTFTIGMTEAGMVLGTASYMAPEQARGKAVDKRADIFAFGVVLYELITGKRLFGGEDAGEMLAKVIRDEPDLSDAPSSVKRLLSECLQKDPRKRLRDIGDVWRLLDGVAPATLLGTPAPLAARRGRWIWPALAALFFLSTAAIGLLHFREKPRVLAPVRFQIYPATRASFDSVSLSPDGRKVLFNVRGMDGQNSLWIRMMDSTEMRELPGTQGAFLDAVWSPDSQSVAFLAQGNLKKIDIAGGAPEVVAPAHNPATGLSWTRPDVILFGANGLINRVSASGGDPSAVTALDPHLAEQAQGRPLLLPDGNHFLYYRMTPQVDKMGVYSGSLDAKPDAQSKRLLDTPAGVVYAPARTGSGGYLLYLRENSLMAQPFDAGRMELTGNAIQLADHVGTDTFYGFFSVSNNGALAYAGTASDVRQLTWYDRKGTVLGHVGDPAPRDEMELSPDGTRLVEGRVDERGTWVVWMLDLARGVNTRLTFDTAGAGNAVWSPDGSQIVYATGGGQSADLYRKPANGASQGELLLHSPETKMPLDWSRDGHYLLFGQRGKGTGQDLWALRMDGDRKPFPYLATPFNEGQAQFSPDGRWVAYVSNESGKPEVYVQPFPMSANGKWPVSNAGGMEPRWRPDGKELFYFAPNNTLMAVSVTTKGETFEPGVPQPLFRAPILGGLGGATLLSWRWAVSRDGQRFLINTASDEATSTPVTILMNWQSTLK